MKKILLTMGLLLALGFAMGAAKYKPLVTTAKCTGCSECAAVCPVKAIKVTHDKAAIDPEICIGCMACVRVCSWKAVQ